MALKRRNVIIFLENIDLLSIIFSSLTSDNFSLDGFYTFVIVRISDDDAELVFAKLWQKFFYNINILAIANERVIMKTFLPFTDKVC